MLITGIWAFHAAQSPETLSSPSAAVTAAAPTPSPEPSPEPTPTPLPAPLNFHRWGSITLFNGLPSDSVRAIAQTSDAVMWFGTDNGLARFDGRRIEKISLGGPDADRIRVLRSTNAGELWIGTSDGLFRYDDAGYQQVEGTEDLSITSLNIGEEIVFGTGIGTVMKIVRGENGELRCEPLISAPILGENDSPLAITGVAIRERDVLVSTAGRGVFEIRDGQASELLILPRPIFVNSLEADDGGRLILGADAGAGQSGVYEYAAGSSGKRLAAGTGIVLAVEADNGNVWVGTERNGLFRFDNSGLNANYTFANTSGGLRSDYIFTLFTDREGVLWIGTNRGVSRFDRAGPLQETVSDSPNGNFIRSLYKTAGGRILAGSNKGLFESTDNGWKPVPGLDRRVIHAIAEPAPTTVLIGTSSGTLDISGRTLAPGDTRAFCVFDQRTFAAVFGRGVVELPQRGRVAAVSAEPMTAVADPLVTTVSAGQNAIWAGTSDGRILRHDVNQKLAETLAEDLNTGAVRRIAATGDRELWIGAENGVFHHSNGVTQRAIDVKEVRDIHVSGEEIWAATTSRGLVHARNDKNFGWLTSTIGFEQGLPSEKMFAILPLDDALLVASNRGVVTYRPGRIAPKLIAPRVLSQRIHHPHEVRSRIDLEYPQNSLVVEVAGLSSRTSPQEFQYGFLLKDGTGNIIEKRVSSDPQFAPSDLKAGDHTIEAWAFDRDLLASEPLTVSFRVARAPFPWTATALAMLLAVAVVALIWAIVERRRIVQRNRELAAARFDLANEAERERNRIARDLHDQTLADLRSLMMKTDRLAPDNNEIRNEIESISTEIRRICEDLSPSVLENVGLIAALEFLLRATVENPGFDAPENAEDQVRLPINVQLQIYRIASEVLTNIQRHAKALRVEMRVAVGPGERFHVEITDDGVPFDPYGASSRGRGIGNIRTRAALIQARITWESSPSRNRFTLDINGRE